MPLISILKHDLKPSSLELGRIGLGYQANVDETLNWQAHIRNPPNVTS